MRIYKGMTDLIGHTPLIELSRFSQAQGLTTPLVGKFECFNPGSSVKDRAALFMIEEAERSGRLTPESVIIEPTSGNTGIGLCAMAAMRGYRIQIVMPETMSMERRLMMKAYGAELVLTPGPLGMKGAIQKAEELAQTIPNAVILGQFVNPANPEAHLQTTGPEIYDDTEGKVDIVIAGVGTGGTVSGIGQYFKRVNPSVKIMAVEPIKSPVLSGGQPSPHGIQGIGAGFIPSIYDANVVDEVIPVDDERAMRMSRQLGRQEGILVGISAGAALAAAVDVARRPENAKKLIVVILPDSGERYLSTRLYAEG